MSLPLASIRQRYAARIDTVLQRALPAAETPPARLHAAMHYAVFNGGKRIRPFLAYNTADCLGLPLERVDAPAAAIELIHAFSLVHDDLPAMDDDDLRRGQPTVHREFDEATAILAADALQPLAFAVLARSPGVSDEVRCRLVELLAKAAGSLGMTGGQAIDIAAEGCELTAAEVEQMYAWKTGALIHAAVMSACIVNDALAPSAYDAFDRFAHDIGVAFQIKDDILDVEGDTEIIGKPAGSDVSLRKATYPRLFGVAASRRRCDELLDSALGALQALDFPCTPLRELASYIVSRAH